MWPTSQETADLVTFTEEILNGKLHFLCSLDSCPYLIHYVKYTRIRLLSGRHISVFRLNLAICELPDHSDWKVIDCLHRLFQLKIGTCGFRFNFAEVLNFGFDLLFRNYVQYILLREWFLEWNGKSNCTEMFSEANQIKS